ncbi:MAG: hypothetical protein ACYC25_07560 [Paludibacter sp.]
MKKIKSLIALSLCVMAVFFTACKTEEPEVFGKPVLGTNFTVTVDGNKVVLNCTMKTATAVLWQASNGIQKTNKQDTLYLPVAGDYNVVLNVSNGGDYLASDTVPFTIASTDVEYYNAGIWKALTGGSGVKKTWVLDLDKKFFHNPLDFYGDAAAGLGADGKSWGPWGGTSIVDWGGTPENGEISFDAISGQVSFTLDGVTKTGKYSFKTYDRPDDFITPPLADGTLWNNFLTGKYSYLGSLSPQMGDMKFTAGSGLRFPMDVGRINNDSNKIHPSQFETADLENVVIMHCTDSSMIVRVKRSYEGDKASTCWLLYNYVVKEYTYKPEVMTYTEPIKTSFTASDLVGTWKYDAVAQDWIGWDATGTKGTSIQSALLNNWDTRAAMVTTLTGWGAKADSTFTANDANSYVFENNGSCTLAGKANTYTVANGKITFGTALTTEFSQVFISLTGTVVTIADPKSGTAIAGLWLAQQNDAKKEYKAVHLKKQ